MKAFKTLKAALAHAGWSRGEPVQPGQPDPSDIICVGDLYLAGMTDNQFTEITLLRWEEAKRMRAACYMTKAQVTKGHFARLGNANWAKSQAEQRAAKVWNLDPAKLAMWRALGVIALSPATVAWLAANDPMALAQVRAAFNPTEQA